MSDWPETRRDFCRIAARMGVAQVAEQIPAGRDTVYRLLRGETEQPTRAVKAGIERIVKEHKHGTGN
jgi:DNA-binding phage protein